MWTIDRFRVRFFAEENDTLGGASGDEETLVELGTNEEYADLESGPELDSKPEETPEEEEVETPKDEESNKQSFLDSMKERFFGKKEPSEESDDKSVELEEDISESFTDAALKSGWTEEEIVDFASEYTNEQLEEMLPLILSETEEVEEEEEEPDTKEEVEGLEDIDEKLKPFVDRITKSLEAKYQEKIEAIEERLKEADQERSVEEAIEYQSAADDFFDKLAEKHPVFGKTEDLKRYPTGSPKAGEIIPFGPAFEARNEVWKTAASFYQMGMPWNKALDEAATWYRGKNLEKDVRSQVLKELKSNEKRLSPKRTQNNVSFKDKNVPEHERKRMIIDEIARNAGINA